MWITWAMIALLAGFIQFLFNCCKPLAAWREHQKFFYIDMSLMMILNILCLLALVMGAFISNAKDDNQNRVPASSIPGLAANATSWCNTTSQWCSTLISTPQSCDAFNAMMLNVGTQFKDVIAPCLNRIQQVCNLTASININITNPGLECSTAWADYNYALVRNDANTEPKYRLIVNIAYGCLLNLATIVGFTFLSCTIYEYRYRSIYSD